MGLSLKEIPQLVSVYIYIYIKHAMPFFIKFTASICLYIKKTRFAFFLSLQFERPHALTGTDDISLSK